MPHAVSWPWLESQASRSRAWRILSLVAELMDIVLFELCRNRSFLVVVRYRLSEEQDLTFGKSYDRLMKWELSQEPICKMEKELSTRKADMRKAG